MAKLGELFVDLGVNSGNALNSLTNFSIKFLAVKNAAQQFGNVVDGLFGDTARYGQELVKMNSITGLSTEWFQKMKFRAEQTGSSLETVVGTLKELQRENAKILMGEGNISPFQKLGIDMSKMREPVQLLDEVMDKVLRLQPAFRQAMLSELGISEEILFMYQQKTLEVGKSLQLTKEEIDSLSELSKEWEYTKQTISAWWDKKIAGMSDVFRGILAGFRMGFGTGENQTGSSQELELSVGDNAKNKTFGETAQDYFANTEPMYNYGGSTVTYNDNSNTTINTSDGASQYEKLNREKINKTKSEFSNVEMISRRG